MNKLATADIHEVLSLAFYRILKSMAKLAMRHGLSSAAMGELVRRAYLAAAEEIIKDEGGKIRATRISAMTGLYRKEIRRLEELPAPGQHETDIKYNRCTRVVTGWLRDSDFHTEQGQPADLSIGGENGFDELVRRYSGDMSPSAMRVELERLEIIVVTKANMIRLNTQGFVSASDIEGFQILGTDTSALIDTIDHNLSVEKDQRHFQRKVMHYGIPDEHLESFRNYSAIESQKLLELLDRWLSERLVKDESCDSNSVGLGIYHFESKENPDKEAPNDD